MKVFILGISGWIGNSLQHKLKSRGHAVAGSWCYTMPPHPTKGVQFDQVNPTPLYTFLEIYQPDVVVHLLEGLTEEALNLHKNLSLKAEEEQFHYVFLSAAAALDRSYEKSETALARAHSRYGQFKAACEQELRHIKNSLVVRAATCHGGAEHKSTRTSDFFEHLQKGETIYFPDLLVQNHIWIEDLTAELCELIDQKQTGMVHLLGAEASNEFEFRKKLAKAFGYKEELIQCGEHEDKDMSLTSLTKTAETEQALIVKLLADPLLQKFKV